jgi:hypothetical protein
METPWKKYKEKNGITPFDLINPTLTRVSDEEYDQRLDICKACPSFLHMTNQCKKCGCFMNFKAKYQISKCPIGKW